MSFITVSQLRSKITPKLHTGNSAGKIGTAYQQMGEAAAFMLSRIDPPDTIQKQRIDTAVYSHIYNYTCPTDLKGIDRIIDLRPIWSTNRPRDGYRYPSEYSGAGFDDTVGANLRQFDIKKYRNTLAVETLAGIKTLRISKQIGAPTGNGTTLSMLNHYPDAAITTSGDVQNVAQDTLDYIDYTGSVSFGLSGVTGQGIVTIQLPNTIDLSRMVNLGSIFHWLKFPDATRFTNVTVRFGSSPVAYWQNVLTIPQGRTAMDSNAWDLMRADWTQSTVVGSPDSTQMSYFQLIFNYTTGTALTFCKINALTAALGQAYELTYYSSGIFRDASTGALKQIPTKDDDQITVDPAATTILLWETIRLLAQEQQGKNSAADISTATYHLEGDGRVIRSMLVMNRQGLYRDWIQQNPSQAIPMEETYFQFDDLSGY